MEFVLLPTQLLISAPSLGVYYCQQLTLSVRMSVRVSHSFKLLLLFCFSMESSHFLAVISPCAPWARCGDPVAYRLVLIVYLCQFLLYLAGYL